VTSGALVTRGIGFVMGICWGCAVEFVVWGNTRLVELRRGRTALWVLGRYVVERLLG
jgi:hypothetical protein